MESTIAEIQSNNATRPSPKTKSKSSTISRGKVGCSDLLACPFCASEVKVEETEGFDYVIQCKCGVCMTDDMDWGKKGYDGRKNLISKWNKRAS